MFHKKGYMGTRTRDIAEHAGINLALLNYYFRSKEKLFHIIMIETMSGFFHKLTVVLDDEHTGLMEKVERIATEYIDLIIKEPEVPGFILGEIRTNPSQLIKELPIQHLTEKSVFVTQYRAALAQGQLGEANPLHFLMNLLALVVFPFIAKPIMMGLGRLEETEFKAMMQQRKKLIPLWIDAIIRV